LAPVKPQLSNRKQLLTYEPSELPWLSGFACVFYSQVALMKKLIAYFQTLKFNGFKWMSTSMEGIVEKAGTFTGVVRALDFRIVLVNDADEPISNAKCKVMFQNGQEILVESSNKGILKFHRRAQGKLKVKLLESEETRKENSGGQE